MMAMNADSMSNNKGPAIKRSSKYAALQFFRTALCNDFAVGVCPRGDKCTFAHGEENLCTRPSLGKTKMCPHKICSQKNCTFAHSRKELVSTGSFWKTSMCRFGHHCKIRTTCRFAHDQTELREKTHNGESIDPKIAKEMQEQMTMKSGSLNGNSSTKRRPDSRKTVGTKKMSDDGTTNVPLTMTNSSQADNMSQDFDVLSIGQLRQSVLDASPEVRPSSRSLDPAAWEIMDRVSSEYPASYPWWSMTEDDLISALPTCYED